MKEVFIFSYGCDLDHNNIDVLVKERLMPYSDHRSYLRNEMPPKESDICLKYDVFDINRNKHKDNLYSLDKFYINKVRLEAFMYSLSKLKGDHIYANPNVRGHATVNLDNVEYTARVYGAVVDEVDDKRLVFLDEESLSNVELREKLPSLPSDLQFLTMPIEITLEERESLVSEWIQRIICEVKNKKK
ncbi:hypothetical protein H7992_22005 [Sporosarcina sp. resist]|uniref:hypothetical protein n=1 Tax=Sporosarcina sp. resist TaxID=2762563 RepID=UPI00164ED1D0|nr:hypothetical protein [Sporosarcina sp. resist]QNK87807.1 hypothetical protein H7992_22005 [Sporosarcina sp. resist]